MIQKIIGEYSNQVVFTQQYLYHKEIKISIDEGKTTTVKQSKQQHVRQCFAPIAVETLTRIERDWAQQALIYLDEKHDDSIKRRLVYNGKANLRMDI